jgi:type II secretory pathway pseudopilin PulG
MRIAVFVAAGLVALTSFLHAQSDDDDEDEMDYAPLVPTGSSLRFGLRYVGGPKVSFHNVGTVPANLPILGVSDTAAHFYNDGAVSPDTRVDGSGHPANDGLTNTWIVNYATQITSDNNVAYHIYSTTSLPDEKNIKAQNSLASGWELQMGRSLGKIARKVDVSLVAGFTFSGFNSKQNGVVQSQLTTLTDVYSLNGQAPPTTFPTTEPNSGTQTVYDSNGQPVLTPSGGVKTVSTDQSILLGLIPTRTISSTNSDGKPTITDVRGLWQIKGAYYTFRLGPVFQLPVTERLKLSLGFGAAAVFAGSTYTASETVLIDNVSFIVRDGEVKTHSVILPAWYADADAEYWLTERAGFYLGATYQRSQSYNQNLGGRSATVDMGSTSGITSGLTLRF